MVNGGFWNISNTIQLMKSCVKVLRKDRELILFPIMAAICSLIVGVDLFNWFNRFFSSNRNNNLFFLLLFDFGANFIIVFFLILLISAALERLRGGDPNISSGLSHVLSMSIIYFSGQ